MTRNRTLVPMLALAVAVLFSGAALAQPAGCGDCGGQKGMAQTCGKGKGMGMMAIPNLTEAQQNQIDDLRAGHIKDVAGIRTDIEIKQLELARLWRADKLDGAKIVAKVKELGELRSKLQVANVNHHLDVYKLLTPEQQKEFRPPMMGGMGQGKGMGRGKAMGRGMGRMGGCGMGGGMQGGCGGSCGGQ